MYIISACLCGVNCKYNGLNNQNDKCIELFKNGKGILVCPEELGGLSTPRLTAEILGKAGEVFTGKGTVVNNINEDVSLEFIKGAYETLKIVKLNNIKKAILKEGSPSCGANFMYDGNFSGNKIKGCGITTYILRENGVNVISEQDLEEIKWDF